MSTSCGSYRSGHLAHWIQAKKSHEPDQPAMSVKVTAVDDDVQIHIEGDGVRLVRRLHRPSGGWPTWTPSPTATPETLGPDTWSA